MDPLVIGSDRFYFSTVAMRLFMDGHSFLWLDAVHLAW